MSPYTLVVTSCDRHDLLRETLESFIEMADQKPAKTIIIEDSAKPMPAWIDGMRAALGGILWIPNGKRIGQLFSIDEAYSHVETSWIFHCEDDWKFVRTGFIARSFEILESYPGISTVSLRGDEWCHPYHQDPRFPFKIAQPYWGEYWGGLSWNPGLRRRGDYVRIGGSYGKHVSYSLGSCDHEKLISKKYLDMGYNVAWAADEPHVEHLGEGRSRAVQPLAKPLKILIAVPATHNRQYGEFESGTTNEPRLGVHISGPNDRIAAVRDTWWKDVGNHSGVEAKFFYGKPSGDSAEVLGDEVILDCPDDYEGLTEKTRAVAQYAIDHDFDYVFKCDDDTAVYVDRLVAEILKHRPEYGGYMNGNSMSGGPGYIMSRRALPFVAKMKPGNRSWAEDVSVWQVLSVQDFFPTMLIGHRPGFSDHWFFPNGFDASKLKKNIVTMHAVGPTEMRAWYEHKEQL
jgi:hypothetical protein